VAFNGIMFITFCENRKRGSVVEMGDTNVHTDNMAM
jgi:hypothetical protein